MPLHLVIAVKVNRSGQIKIKKELTKNEEKSKFKEFIFSAFGKKEVDFMIIK